MICDFAVENGYSVQGLTFSPVKGPEGNIEYLVFLQKKRRAGEYGRKHAARDCGSISRGAGQKGLRLMKIAVIPNLDKRDADTYTREILAFLQENGAETLMHEKHRGQYEHVTFCKNHAALAESCDLIVAVGGDGTIIHTAKHASVAGKPILGVNLGRLGFLAGVEKDELHKLKALFTGDYRVRRLMMLSVTVHSVKGDTTYRALNDAVVSGAQSRIYDFGFSVDGSKLYKFRADGLILATPAGSTHTRSRRAARW